MKSLGELFLVLDRNEERNSCEFSNSCGNLFDEFQTEEKTNYSKADTDIVCGLYSDSAIDLCSLCEPARRLYNCSQNAFSGFVHAWMSELPIEAHIISFGRRVMAAGQQSSETAEKAASDRGDPDTRIVLEAAYKTWHEIDRLRGLLRFSPDNEGIYTAYCEPDHFVLPALKEHFSRRFGRTPWAIIDEKRNICIVSQWEKSPSLSNNSGIEWEELWRNYHKTINNESRNNPDLQRKLMPRRYWKYLTEL